MRSWQYLDPGVGPPCCGEPMFEVFDFTGVMLWVCIECERVVPLENMTKLLVEWKLQRVQT